MFVWLTQLAHLFCERYPLNPCFYNSRDGADTSAPQLGVFSGNTALESAYSSSPNVMIRFHSDFSTGGFFILNFHGREMRTHRFMHMHTCTEVYKQDRHNFVFLALHVIDALPKTFFFWYLKMDDKWINPDFTTWCRLCLSESRSLLGITVRISSTGSKWSSEKPLCNKSAMQRRPECGSFLFYTFPRLLPLLGFSSVFLSANMLVSLKSVF